MSWVMPADIPSHLPFRHTLTSLQSSSLPSTPYQQPRDLPFRSTSPSPTRGSVSPRSVHSDFNHSAPARKNYGGGCKYETAMSHFRRRMPYSLGNDVLPEEAGPLKQQLEPDTERKLSGDARELYDRLLPSSESDRKRASFVRKLEDMLNQQWPGNEIKVHVFGSSGNKLCTTASDVDICITTPYNKLDRVCVLADFLAKSGMERVVCVSHAKVPIVKIWDPELQVACDMNVNNTMALENTRMIKTYVDIDERVRPLAMIIKYWAKRRVLNDAALGGTLSSYTWICLIINFLQTRSPPILPSLQQRAREAAEKSESQPSSATFDDDLEALAGFGSKNTSTLGELLFQFFRYYGHEVDYEKTVVSVRDGKLTSKEEKRWHLLHNNRLCVEEPFNTTRNLGNTADDTSFRGLHLELRRAFQEISEGKLHECCEEYEFPPEEERVWERRPPQPRSILTPMPPLPSRGGRGGARGGGRHANNYNRGPNFGRRASSAANRSNMARQNNPAVAAEIALQAQQAQYLLHDHLYQQFQMLQAQEQELRMHQALISSRNGPPIIRPSFLQIAVNQQDGSASDENSRARTNSYHQPPFTAPIRQQNVFFSAPYVPVGISGQTSTNPPSPSMSHATPDLRRNHRRSSNVTSSPKSTLRAQSQPARPIASALNGNFPANYASIAQPETPQPQTPHHVPSSPQRTPTEKNITANSHGQPLSKPGYFDETLPPEYVGYYVSDSPQSQVAYRKGMASSFPSHAGYLHRNNGLHYLPNSQDLYAGGALPSYGPPELPVDQIDPANSAGRNSISQSPARSRAQSNNGPLIIDGSVPVSESRSHLIHDDHSDYLVAPQTPTLHGHRASRHDTPENGYVDYSEPSSYDQSDLPVNGQHHASIQYPLVNGWASVVRNNNKPVQNGHLGRLETLSEQLQRFQLSDQTHINGSQAHVCSTAEPVRYPIENGAGSHEQTASSDDARSRTLSTVSSGVAPTNDSRTSPAMKRRINGVESEKPNGVVSKAKQKARQDYNHAMNSLMTSENNEKMTGTSRKPNGVYPMNGVAGNERVTITNGWQTTKKRNKKGAKASVDTVKIAPGAEPLPIDESLRKGG
ncbi:hypothetical protein FQN57_005230 [Myotisia sp. PD_48]|nr:hypothetical protein FQN57_005230 [Myotisia sp. PD_48]